MPVKWKIFFALNFVLALPAFIFFIVLIINFSGSYRRGEDNFFFAAFAFGLAMIAINGFLNIYIIQRFFPDKLMAPRVKRLNLLSLIITSLIAIGILIVCIYGAAMEFSEDNEGRDISGKVALLVLFALLIIQILVLVMQAQLPGLIGRNTREKMQSLIDSIGNSA